MRATRTDTVRKRGVLTRTHPAPQSSGNMASRRRRARNSNRFGGGRSNNNNFGGSSRNRNQQQQQNQGGHEQPDAQLCKFFLLGGAQQCQSRAIKVEAASSRILCNGSPTCWWRRTRASEGGAGQLQTPWTSPAAMKMKVVGFAYLPVRRTATGACGTL